MADFINTIDDLGDDAVVDGIIQGTITELKDDTLKTVGPYAFYKCTALESVTLENAELSVHDEGWHSFHGCTELQSVDLPSATRLYHETFANCTKLSKVNVPLVTRIHLGTFVFCNALESIDLPSLNELRDNAPFQNCPLLKAVILRSETVCIATVTNIFPNTPIASGTGYIYVPRALVDSYKAATNWSTYAAQFRALEDYTVDGTVTGDLDEPKI